MDNTNFINPAIEAIKANIDAIRSIQENKNDMSFAESAQMFLMDKFGYTQIQAQEVFEELEKGLNEYTTQYEAAQQSDAAITSNILEATANYSPEERTNIMVNVLTSLQLIDPANADSNVEDLLAQNQTLGEEELVKAIAASLDNLPFQYVMDSLKDGLTPEVIALIGNTKEMRTREFKLAAAVMLYSAQKEGKLKFASDDVELSPRVIGGLAGAGADAMVATADLQEGKIELSTWQYILKCALTGLFCVAFAAICTYALLTVNALIAWAIFSVFGFGLLSTLVALPAMFYFTKAGIKTSEEEYAALKEKLSALYDPMIVKLTAWAKGVIEKIKAWMVVARQKVVDVASRLKTPKQNTEAEVSTEAEPSLA